MLEYAALAVGHLTRRHFLPPVNLLHKRGEEPESPFLQIPNVILLIFFLVGLIATEYTLRYVIGTLAMVEMPAAAITVTPVPADTALDASIHKQQATHLLETGTSSITVVHTKPITSSIRESIRHLKANGGFRSRFRGYRAYLIYNFCFAVCFSVVRAVLPRFLVVNEAIAATVAAVVCAPLHMAWTHAMISTDSAKSWRSRVSTSSWKQLAAPAALWACIPQIIAWLSVAFYYLLELPTPSKYQTSELWKSAIFILVEIFLILFVTLPAMVTLIRIEASLLPDDEECIVPFDRSFGGKVVPRILGGSGAIGFVDAWRTFNWEARRRLVKHYIKTAMVMLGIVAAYLLIIFVELAIVSAHSKPKSN